MFANFQSGWRVLLLLLLFKLVYLGGVLLAVRIWPDLNEEKFYEITAHWFPASSQESPVFLAHFSTWDAAHYLYLSKKGYQNGVKSCAFYPLWPLVIRGSSKLGGSSPVIAGMVLANVFSLVAWMLFYQIVTRRFGETVALWALVFLIVFPGSLFYQFIYSESLFLLLVMLLWLGLERERYDWARPAAFLLPLCRGIGLFCILAIAWHLLTRKPLPQLAWIQKWASGKAKSEPVVQNNNPVSTVNNWGNYGLLAAPLLGWAVYIALMWGWTGNPFEGIQAQRFWGVHSIGNLVNVPKFVIGFFTPTQFHEFKGSMLDRCLFILLVYTLPVIWRLGKDMLVWTYVLGILPAMSGTFTSFTRFESCAFPLFIALAVFFSGSKRKWPLIIFILLSAMLHAILLWRFVNFRWAG